LVLGPPSVGESRGIDGNAALVEEGFGFPCHAGAPVDNRAENVKQQRLDHRFALYWMRPELGPLSRSNLRNASARP
jgi:hypothetical protein